MPDVLDPYGTDIAIGPDGDLFAWPNGAMATLEGPDNCVQALVSRQRTSIGELTLHPTYGSVLPALVGQKLSAGSILGQAVIELRRLVESDPRFLVVSKVTVTESSNEAVAISATLQLSAGERLAASNLVDVAVIDVLPVDNSTVGFVDGADSPEDELPVDDLPDFDAGEALLDDLTPNLLDDEVI